MTETILRFPSFEIDLRRPLTGAQRARLRALGLGRRFAIITPFNPRGENISAAANTGRLKAFTRELAGSPWARVPADGCSINRRHVERGYAIGLSRRAALALARRADQLAFFWWDGARFLLVWCDHPRRGMPLPARLRVG